MGVDEDDKNYQKSLEFVFEVVLLSIVGILGIIGNCAAIVLFARLKLQLKFHRLMMMLSAFDLLYVVLSLMLFTFPQVCTCRVFLESLILLLLTVYHDYTSGKRRLQTQRCSFLHSTSSITSGSICTHWQYLFHSGHYD